MTTLKQIEKRIEDKYEKIEQKKYKLLIEFRNGITTRDEPTLESTKEYWKDSLYQEVDSSYSYDGYLNYNGVSLDDMKRNIENILSKISKTKKEKYDIDDYRVHFRNGFDGEVYLIIFAKIRDEEKFYETKFKKDMQLYRNSKRDYEKLEKELQPKRDEINLEISKLEEELKELEEKRERLLYESLKSKYA